MSVRECARSQVRVGSDMVQRQRPPPTHTPARHQLAWRPAGLSMPSACLGVPPLPASWLHHPTPTGCLPQIANNSTTAAVPPTLCRTVPQGFPDHHHFSGNVHNRHRQVGNAVPPPLARALGMQLRRKLEDRAAKVGRGRSGRVVWVGWVVVVTAGRHAAGRMHRLAGYSWTQAGGCLPILTSLLCPVAPLPHPHPQPRTHMFLRPAQRMAPTHPPTPRRRTPVLRTCWRSSAPRSRPRAQPRRRPPPLRPPSDDEEGGVAGWGAWPGDPCPTRVLPSQSAGRLQARVARVPQG